jgi:hypothetical protein
LLLYVNAISRCCGSNKLDNFIVVLVTH